MGLSFLGEPIFGGFKGKPKRKTILRVPLFILRQAQVPPVESGVGKKCRRPGPIRPLSAGTGARRPRSAGGARGGAAAQELHLAALKVIDAALDVHLALAHLAKREREREYFSEWKGGRKEGRKEGRKKGRKEGRKEGKKEERE